jgi:hypothetical protein
MSVRIFIYQQARHQQVLRLFSWLLFNFFRQSKSARLDIFFLEEFAFHHDKISDYCGKYYFKNHLS